jgi:tetratricopeptide (TPR) repeat protein
MSIERGSILYQTGRHEAAELEFRAALVDEPSNALAHAMIGLCLVQQKKYAEATEEAQQAVALRPDWSFGYYAMAAIFYARERLKEAAAAIGRAIELDPFNPSHHGILAEIRLKQRDWKAALAAADAGLAIEPEHAACINARGVALVNLGRREEASQTIAGALQNNPHNATTHANQGWALLHAGDYKAALEHFREALRIDPESRWAKSGIVEALKARNPIYRAMLKYFLFMSRMGRQVQWGIIVGGYIAFNLLRQAADSNPQLSPWVTPILIAYGVFAVLTWLAAPLFNLMLRIDRFGRYALSRDQRVCSNWIGSCLAIAIALAITAWIKHDVSYVLYGVLIAVLAIPLSAVFGCPRGWPRWAMSAYTAGLMIFVVIVIARLFTAFAANDRAALDQGMQWMHSYMLAVVVSQFAANGLAMARVTK